MSSPSVSRFLSREQGAGKRTGYDDGYHGRWQFSLGIEPTDQSPIVSLEGYKNEEVKLDSLKSDYEIVLQQQ
ncbi:MAG: hypothetical protein QM664_03460 [Flavihumibacter sp.]